MTTLDDLKSILHESGASCVIANGDGNVRLFRERGVRDLYNLLTNEPQLLRDALVADKVVGKGAAALMALGGVAKLYADVVSQPAQALLLANGVELSCGKIVGNIINRLGTDICPVEKLCSGCATPQECLPLIHEFMNNQNKK